MNDWNTEVAGQYELNVESMRKGRGAWIFETDRGLKLLKEYRGSVKRLEFEELVLGAVAGAGSLRVDQYVRNKEGELLSTASDGIRYVVKDWFSDRECDLKDTGEILSAVRQIAVLHKAFEKGGAKGGMEHEVQVSPAFFMAMEKHNRELKKARAFIRGNSRKMSLSFLRIASFEPFLPAGRSGGGGDEKAVSRGRKGVDGAVFHLPRGAEPAPYLMGRDYVAVTGFGRMHLGAPGGGSLLFHAEGHGEVQLGLRAGKWDAGGI